MLIADNELSMTCCSKVKSMYNKVTAQIHAANLVRILHESCANLANLAWILRILREFVNLREFSWTCVNLREFSSANCAVTLLYIDFGQPPGVGESLCRARPKDYHCWLYATSYMTLHKHVKVRSPIIVVIRKKRFITIVHSIRSILLGRNPP